jgi:hypothetical protein
MSLTLAGKTTTDGAAIITIPAGNSWRGSVSLSALSDTAGTFYPDITVQGTNADPASGSAVNSVVVFGAVVGLVPEESSMSVSDVIIYAPVGNAVTLQLNLHGTSAAVGTAVGFFQ